MEIAEPVGLSLQRDHLQQGASQRATGTRVAMPHQQQLAQLIPDSIKNGERRVLLQLSIQPDALPGFQIRRMPAQQRQQPALSRPRPDPAAARPRGTAGKRIT